MISVLVAATFRTELLVGMLESLRVTRGDYDVETVLVLDGYSDDDLHNVILRVPGKFILDYSPERRGALRCWNRGLELSGGDILVPAGDDQVFHPGWLDYALESHRDKLGGLGVVGMNDLAYNGNTQVATTLLFDRAYCELHMGGVVAPPVYEYYCVDMEWNEKAKMLNKFYWDERSIVEHVHSAHGKRPVDFLDLEKVENNWAAIDNMVFKKRKTIGFPIEWSSVI